LIHMEHNLTNVEVRVLGSLIEKDLTTPEYYPLSLNALVNACNQKSSRDPVVPLTMTRRWKTRLNHCAKRASRG